METLTRIYIFFIGIIALMVCFITWASIKLRAERIRRIRAEKQGHDDFNKIFNLEYEIKGLKRSIESLDKIIENNKQINQSNESTIKLLEERIDKQSDTIIDLNRAKDNLIKCIERTGIRGLDGVVRKCNAGHIQSVISGTHAILNKPEKKGKNKEELKECAIEIDGKTQLRKYDPMKNAFPVDYNIPIGVEVIGVTNAGYTHHKLKGNNGKTIESDNIKGCDVLFNGEEKTWYMYFEELAPLNPTDHPNYPNLNWE